MNNTEKELLEYAGLVKEVLETQKEYFRTRDKEVLLASKKLEGKLYARTKDIIKFYEEGGIKLL